MIQASYVPALLLLAVCLVSPGSGRAAFRVYADDPGTVAALPDGTTVLNLVVAAGSSPTTTGTACVDGNGDEICAWMVDIESVGDAQFESFEPAAPAETIFNLEEGRLRATGGNRSSGTLGEEAIGTLIVAGSGTGTVRLREAGNNTAVAADMSLVPLDASVIAVPEPGLQAMLVAGVMGALRLARRRAR